MRTNRTSLKLVSVLLAAALPASLWSLSVADAGALHAANDNAADSAKAIERRLDALEARVGTTRTPVSERIDILEKGLRDISRALGGTNWSSVEGNLREARKALEEQRELVRQTENELTKIRREMDETDRRLKQLEAQR